MTNSSASNADRPRVLRVFLSSTFRDMQAERDELARRIFPRLRQLCEERGVSWGEVDLRWGITDEEAAEGRVLPICLAEIDHCRPFFIGLLGERYGWVPDELPDELCADEQFAWLADHAAKSVTELEIWHGALNAGLEGARAFFYFRAPAYLEQLPPDTPRADFASEHSAAAHKLALLKQRIRQSGFPVRDYVTPAAVGQQIAADLSRLIDELFPPLAYHSPQAQEMAAQRDWAARLTQTFIGRHAELARLTAQAVAAKTPLLVTGAVGAGKSALLAAWWRQRQGLMPATAEAVPNGQSFFRRLRSLLPNAPSAAHDTAPAPEEFLCAHFVGASAASAEPTGLMNYVMAALKEHFMLPLALPTQPQHVPTAFANFLQAAAARGRVTLLLDGLDQLTGDDPALALAWLPEELPAKLCLIVTCAPGVALDVLRRRQWSMWEVKPLTTAEREGLIVTYLGQRYRKRLNANLIKQLATTAATASPLYLKTVLEELRVFGQYEALPQRMNHYLTAGAPETLYALMLERFASDYEQERRQLVRDTMRWLWAARQGLSESELLDLLGTPDAPLPYAHWAPFFFAVREVLVERAGVLTFFHSSLRAAVERSYLPTTTDQQAARQELARYFAARPLAPRKLAELPWQLARLQAWESLAALLADPLFLNAAWRARPFEVKSYWAQIEANSSLRLVDYYQSIVAAPTGHATECLWAICSLLQDTGALEPALTLSTHLEQRARAANNADDLQAVLSMRGALLNRRGHWREALAVFAEQEALCRQAGHLAALAAALGNQAVIRREQGWLDEAWQQHKEEEQLCRGLQDEAGLSASLGNQAIILQARGDAPEARRLLREQERICRRLGDLSGLQKSLGNQAALLQRADNLEQALQLHGEEEQLCRRLRDLAAWQACLGNQARIYETLGDFDRAVELLERRERLCRDLRDPANLAVALAQQARLFADQLQQPAHALPFAEEAAALAAQHDLPQLRQETAGLLQAIRRQLA